jgi:hypothetical protein
MHTSVEQLNNWRLIPTAVRSDSLAIPLSIMS